MKVDFVEGFIPGWAMCVPDCFKDSLRTEVFSVGDMFYDTPKAYQLPWGDALKHIRVAIQVKAVGTGAITFNILTPASDGGSVKRTDTRTQSVKAFINSLKDGFK
jgi:hypothetical protein